MREKTKEKQKNKRNGGNDWYFNRKEKSLTSDVDDLEQYSRRNCLLLHRVQENENENANDIVLKTMSEELDIEIKANDLDRTHRIGNRNRRDGKPRNLPAIPSGIRFILIRKIKSEKFLKTESLTSGRYSLLKEAEEKYGVKNVWTSDVCTWFTENNRILIYKSW